MKLIIKIKWFIILAVISIDVLANISTKIDAIVFDCDGVLVDTEPLKYKAWEKMLNQYNLKFSLDEYIPLVGQSSSNILNAILKMKKIDSFPKKEALKNKEDIYKILQANGIMPISSTIEFVKYLKNIQKKYSFKLGLASSAPTAEIKENLKQIGLENAFDQIISGEDDLKEFKSKSGTNKPKPFIYIKIAKLLNVDPSHCLVFEDTNCGVEAAKSAGMFVVALPNSYTIYQNFNKADFIVFKINEFKVEKYLVNN